MRRQERRIQQAKLEYDKLQRRNEERGQKKKSKRGCQKKKERGKMTQRRGEKQKNEI
jgi:hypothetical protein